MAENQNKNIIDFSQEEESDVDPITIVKTDSGYRATGSVGATARQVYGIGASHGKDIDVLRSILDKLVESLRRRAISTGFSFLAIIAGEVTKSAIKVLHRASATENAQEEVTFGGKPVTVEQLMTSLIGQMNGLVATLTNMANYFSDDQDYDNMIKDAKLCALIRKLGE